MQIPMDPKTLAILVATLLFLVSLLINLIQRRRHRSQTERLLKSEEETVNFLNGVDALLGKIESACTFELEMARSPEELGKSIRGVRNQIKSSISDVEKNLQSFKMYRQREKARQKHKKQIEKIRKKRLGK